MQGWFSGGPSANVAKDDSPSVLAAWNSYASSQEQEAETGEGVFGLDLEASTLLKSANDTIFGAFTSVSKGVRELPGNVQTAAASGRAMTYFSLLLGAGVFFLFIAFTMFLPVMVLVPQKFSVCFTIGCLLIMSSFFALKGVKAQFLHMTSKEPCGENQGCCPCKAGVLPLFEIRIFVEQRLPFTTAFVGSIVGTIYASMVLHSYILSVLFSVVQVFALLYYVISYFPGGSMGLKFITAMLTSTIRKCFGG